MKIKLLYFVDGLDIGGIQSVVLNLCNHLNKKYDIHIIVLYNDRKALLHKFCKNVKIYFLPFNNSKKGFLYYILYINKLIKLIREINPDILHAHNCSMSYLYFSVAKFFSFKKTKNFRTLHFSGFFLESNLFIDKIRIKLDLWGNKILNPTIVCVSHAVVNNVMKYYKNINLICIHNGIDSNYFNPNKKKEIIVNNDYHVNVICISRLVNFKNHQTLFNAWKILTNEINNISLIIVGDGDLFDHYQKEVHQMGISDTIIFTGGVTNVIEYLKISDLAVFPSLSEGFSLVLLEEMSMGLPVIASNISAFTEIIIDGHNGLIFESLNPNDLADKITFLIKQSKIRKKIGDNARNEVKNKYSLDKMINQYDIIYSKK